MGFDTKWKPYPHFDRLKGTAWFRLVERGEGTLHHTELLSCYLPCRLPCRQGAAKGSFRKKPLNEAQNYKQQQSTPHRKDKMWNGLTTFTVLHAFFADKNRHHLGFLTYFRFLSYRIRKVRMKDKWFNYFSPSILVRQTGYLVVPKSGAKII